MDSQLSYVLFFAFFLVFLSSSPAPADARASPLLRSVCKQTRDSFHQNYTECVKTLWSDARIRSSASNDLKDVAISVLEIAAETATDTQELFNSYLQMETGTKAIQQCAQSYGSVASAFQGTLEGVKEENDMVSNMASRIVDSIVVCEKALSSDGLELPQTISNRVHLVRLYKGIGCTVTSQLVSIWLRARKH